MILTYRSWVALESAVRQMARTVAYGQHPQRDGLQDNLIRLAALVQAMRDRDLASNLEPDGPALLRDKASRATLDELIERLMKGT